MTRKRYKIKYGADKSYIITGTSAGHMSRTIPDSIISPISLKWGRKKLHRNQTQTRILSWFYGVTSHLSNSDLTVANFDFQLRGFNPRCGAGFNAVTWSRKSLFSRRTFVLFSQEVGLTVLLIVLPLQLVGCIMKSIKRYSRLSLFGYSHPLLVVIGFNFHCQH